MYIAVMDIRQLMSLYYLLTTAADNILFFIYSSQRVYTLLSIAFHTREETEDMMSRIPLFVKQNLINLSHTVKLC